MNEILGKFAAEDRREPIDDYFECTTYCSANDHEADCQTICMERHLKENYF